MKAISHISKAVLAVVTMLSVVVSANAAERRLVRIDMDQWNEVDGTDSVAILDMWDAMHVASTLQGIVNRDAPSLYIRYVRQGEVNVDDYWLDKYTADGKWLAGSEIVTVTDPVEAASMFRDKVRGLVVYDSNVFSTSNVASTVAGVEDLIAVRYDTRPGSAYSRLVEQGFRPKVWLVRKNGMSRFKDKIGPYKWAYRHYLRKGRCSGDFAAADNGAGYLNPGQLESPREISGYPDAVDAWSAHNMAHYRKWGLTISGFVIDGAGKGMTERGFQGYAKFSPNGVVAQKCPVVDMVDDMPVLRSGPDVNDAVPEQAAKSILTGLEQHPDFPFYWFRAIIKTPSWYVDVKDKLESSDPDVVWMSAPDFFELLRCYQCSNMQE